MLGFKTIGSAIIIAFDGEPILSTDAWINEDAYFGSWTHDYEIPSQELAEIKQCKFHFMSHGHPDHLNVTSLPDLTTGTLLLADHFGARIQQDLVEMGHNVRVLPTREWVSLSKRIRVMALPNKNQDSILLIDVGGTIIIDANDSPFDFWPRTIRRIAKAAPMSYLTMLCAWSSADMANIYLPDGSNAFTVDSRKKPIAPRLQKSAVILGARRVIPFSSFHRFQRSDSEWANALVPELSDYGDGADPDHAPILPAFVSVDVETDTITPINPRRLTLQVKSPEEFGDNWSDQLDRDEEQRLVKYFKEKEALHDRFGFIGFDVGGKETRIELNKDLADQGLVFSVPRHSLMTAIDYHFFDDLLIGNFMKTTLHGVDGLYPSFTPWVAKYADNGLAQSKQELNQYFHHYFMISPVDHIVSNLTNSAEQVFRRAVSEDSFFFKSAKRIYWGLKKVG